VRFWWAIVGDKPDDHAGNKTRCINESASEKTGMPKNARNRRQRRKQAGSTTCAKGRFWRRYRVSAGHALSAGTEAAAATTSTTAPGSRAEEVGPDDIGSLLDVTPSPVTP
jgi:hypothetical protein